MAKLIRNNSGAALFMALISLVIMGSLASMFVLNLHYGFSSFNKQIKSQIAFNLAEAGIEKAIWHLNYRKSKLYKGEKDTPLGQGTFTITIIEPHPDSKNFTIISQGFYPDSSHAQAECALIAVIAFDKKEFSREGVRVLLWKQIPRGEINKFMN